MGQFRGYGYILWFGLNFCSPGLLPAYLSSLQVLFRDNPHTKFEMSSSTHSKDIIFR